MKKSWHAPTIETLDVRLTENGTIQYTEEGDLFFKPEVGEEVFIGETHS